MASLRPLFDRVLVRVAEAKSATKGGVLLPESAKEKPLVGDVVAVGPGKEGKDGKEEMRLAPVCALACVALAGAFLCAARRLTRLPGR